MSKPNNSHAKPKGKSKGAATTAAAARQLATAAQKVERKMMNSAHRAMRTEQAPRQGKKELFAASQKVLLQKGAAATVCRAITLPMTYAAKVPTGWQTAEVASANPLSVSLQDRSTPGAGTDSWAGGSFMVGISRDPLRHICMSWTNPTISPWTYTSRFTSETLAVGNDYTLGRLLITCAGPQFIDLHPVSFNYASGPSAYGDLQFTCQDGGYTYIWLDAGLGSLASAVNGTLYTTPTGSTLITASTSGAAARMDVIPLLEDTGAITYSTGAVTSGQFHVDIYASGYYRFRLEIHDGYTTTGTNAYFELLLYGVCSTIQFLPMPGILARKSDIQGIQVIGAAIMVSQDATAMASGGRVCGVQLEEGECPTTYKPADVTVSWPTAFENRNKFEEMKFTNGMYAWHKPTSDKCLQLQKPFRFNPAKASTNFTETLSQSQVIGYRSPLRPCGGWTVIAVATPPSVGSTTAFPGALFRVTTSASVNIETLSTWYHVSPAKYRISADEIIAILEKVPQYTENPLHFRDIMSWINRNSGALKGLAKGGLTALSGAFAPELLPVVNAFNALY